MKNARWVVLIAIITLSAVFLFRYTFQKSRPDIPADQTHTSVSIRGGGCLPCHSPGGPLPRSRNHPVGTDCRHCHFWEGERR